MAGPTRQPLLPRIQICKNSDKTGFTQVYEFNPLVTPKTLNFNLEKMSCRPPSDKSGGKAEFTITSPATDNATMNTILSNISEGNHLKIWSGKSTATSSLIFLGIIESIEIEEPTKNLMRVTISAPDWGSDLLKHIVVNGSWRQRRLTGSPNLADPNDNTTTVLQIISDLVSRADKQTNTQRPTAVQFGLVYSASNIQIDPNFKIPQFEANNEKLEDKLSAIDDVTGTNHFIDANKNLIVTPNLQWTNSDILLVDDVNDSVAASWAAGQDHVGYIGPMTHYKRTLEAHNAEMLGIGGNTTSIDQSKTTVTNNDKLDVNYYAMQFIPTQNECEMIEVYVGYVGTPTANLIFSLIEDNAAKPEGTILRTLSKTKDDVVSGGNWVPFQVSTTLNAGKKYWIVLAKEGDASNTFQWYRDAASTGVSGFSTTGLPGTWTIDATGFNYAYKEYYGTPLLSIYPYSITTTTSHPHEEVYNYPYIRDRATLSQYLQAIATTITTKKEIFSGSIFAPDTLFTVGQYVRIRKQVSGYVIDGNYTVGEIEYLWQSDESNTTGMFYINIQATLYSTYT